MGRIGTRVAAVAAACALCGKRSSGEPTRRGCHHRDAHCHGQLGTVCLHRANSSSKQVNLLFEAHDQSTSGPQEEAPQADADQPPMRSEGAEPDGSERSPIGQKPTPSPTPTPTPTPAGTAVFGMSANGEAALRDAETKIGVKAGVVGVFADFAKHDFPTHDATYAANRGAALMVSWEPWDWTVTSQNQPTYSLDNITMAPSIRTSRSSPRPPLRPHGQSSSASPPR